MASENAEKFLADNALTGNVRIKHDPRLDERFADSKRRNALDGQEGKIVDSHGGMLFDVFAGSGKCGAFFGPELQFETIAEVEAKKKAEAEAKKAAKK